MNVTEAVINKNNIKINIGKTELIACRTTAGTKRLNVQIGNGKIGEISEFCYLGSKITIYCRCNADIHFRVGQTTIAFAKISQIIWVDKLTNEKVLNFVKEERSLYVSIKRRPDRLIGHTLRQNNASHSRGLYASLPRKVKIIRREPACWLTEEIAEFRSKAHSLERASELGCS